MPGLPRRKGQLLLRYRWRAMRWMTEARPGCGGAPSVHSPGVSSPSQTREQRFRVLYGETYDSVVRFARRRSGPEHQAGVDDVVADAFLVAWRRLDDVPTRGTESLAWMYAVTRNCLLNARRSGQRRDALAVRVSALEPPPDSADSTTVATDLRMDLAAAWQTLPAADQEILALALFDDLGSRDAARVLGITAASYRMRLSRARRALRVALDLDPAHRRKPGSASTSILQENC